MTDLVRYLKEVHKHADEEHERVRDQSHRTKLRVLGVGQGLAVGDYCLVLRPPTPGISVRLQSRHFNEIYQVMEVHGDGSEAKAYTVSDLRGQRDDLGFTQPVAAYRLTPIDLLPLTAPSVDSPSRILLDILG